MVLKKPRLKIIILLIAIVALFSIASFLLGFVLYQINLGGAFTRLPSSIIGKIRDVTSSYDTSSNESIDRMVVKTASVSLETPDVVSATRQIEALAASFEGYVVQSNLGNQSGTRWGYVSFRVPATHFLETLEALKAYGSIKERRIQNQDVTEQYVDLDSRLRNLERQEGRLLEILVMAKTVSEVLEVERELERVRGEIERLTGQLNYLRQSVEMSLIQVYLTEPPALKIPTIYWEDAIEIGILGWLYMAKGAIILGMWAIPFLILGIPTYYAYRRLRRGSRAPQPSSQVSAQVTGT
ncbi:DUF4349 domain-containing protein [Candidatus Bathyarchaeota archaeon]|nr:DUF4349 domain-containing protein [Candidatus Bathyarchaeota archaeon]